MHFSLGLWVGLGSVFNIPNFLYPGVSSITTKKDDCSYTENQFLAPPMTIFFKIR